MKLKALIINNFRRFENLEVDFQGTGMSVIIGSNGSGKTTLLDAISICMTHYTGEVMSSTEGYNIEAWFREADIRLGASKGFTELELNSVAGHDRRIRVSKAQGQRGLSFDKVPTDWIKDEKSSIQSGQLEALPVIAYYHVNRTADCSEEKTKKTAKLYDKKLQAYVKALSKQSPNIRNLEDWLIEQQRQENDYKVAQNDLSAILPSLDTVRRGLLKFLSLLGSASYSNMTVRRTSDLQTDFSEAVEYAVTLDKNGETFLLSQLSHGERMVVSLAMEVARRLYLAGPNQADPLRGPGVVLIDEIELHLHPTWQSRIVRALIGTFPNVHFILTTHSPLVLSDLRNENIIRLVNGEIIPTFNSPNLHGARANEMLTEMMLAPSGSDAYREDEQEIRTLMNQMKFDEAKVKLDSLKEKMGSSPRWLIDMEQVISFSLA